MNSKRKLLMLPIAALFASSVLFAETIDRIGDTEANWTDEGIWDHQTPTSADNARLYNGTITNLTSDVTVTNIGVDYDSTLNVTSGTLKVSDILYHNQATVNLSGTSKTTVREYNFGESADSIEGGTLNVFGSASLSASTFSSSIRIGYNLTSVDAVANVYDSATIYGRLKIGSEAAGATGKSTLNVYGNATGTIDYINLYQNATLNLSGNAKLSVTNDLRFGDMTGDSVNSVSLKGSSQISARSAFIFDNATVTVAENAVLSITGGNGYNLRIGSDYSGTVTKGALVLKDSATLKVSQNLSLQNGSILTLEGSKIQKAEGSATHVQALGASNLANQGGTIKFIADADGISAISTRYLAYVDTVESTGYALELDFSKLALGEGTYLFDVITATENATRENTILSNYAENKNNIISVITASDSDSYELIKNGLKLQISYTVVPEPATYAAIFGALALAFAAYRKRK